MPHQQAIHPMEDPYHKAAHLVLDGDLAGAWEVVEGLVKHDALARYEPIYDADEDGQYSDHRGPAESAVDNAIESVSGSISDAIWEVLTNEQGMETTAAESLATAKHKELYALWGQGSDARAMIDDVIEDYAEGVSARDPYAYHGVSRSDFF